MCSWPATVTRSWRKLSRLPRSTAPTLSRGALAAAPPLSLCCCSGVSVLLCGSISTKFLGHAAGAPNRANRASAGQAALPLRDGQKPGQVLNWCLTKCRPARAILDQSEGCLFSAVKCGFLKALRRGPWHRTTGRGAGPHDRGPAARPYSPAIGGYRGCAAWSSPGRWPRAPWRAG